jgi:hypothetical protein
MKKFIKEPLVHFVLLGIAIFIFYALIDNKEESQNTVVFDTYDLENIMASWEMQWKRPPSQQELSNLISQNIKQEIFYQEALMMNLDHNDEIIKRRLAQKMEFLSNDLATMQSPTEKELQEYYESHKEKYKTPYMYSLYQIPFSPDNRSNPKQDAELILKKHGTSSIKEMEGRGDRLPFSYFMNDLTANQLALKLGNSFPEALENQDLNQWTGPIPSGFGYHLVYIEKKSNPSFKNINAIKSDVINDFNYDRQQEFDIMIYNELKKKYLIDFNIDSKAMDPKIIKEIQDAINR